MSEYTTFKIWREGYSTLEFPDTYASDKVRRNSVGKITNLDDIVEEYAEEFHDNRDGWECAWPIEFSVATEDDQFLGKFKVERDYITTFGAKEVK